jgi:alpha,alpha-trehalase
MKAHACIRILSAIILSSVSGPEKARSDQPHEVIRVNVKNILAQLLGDEDTDGDIRITVADSLIPGTKRGDKQFIFSDISNRTHKITGNYHLSNLLQELELLHESGNDTGQIRLDRIYEPPADRISRNIRQMFWDSLTRHIDGNGLASVISDEKSPPENGQRYIYIPPTDLLAFDYFNSISRKNPGWNLNTIRLPEYITPEYVKGLDKKAGLLTLSLEKNKQGKMAGVPFVIPGGRFNEMYGWDSYFILLGLLQDGRAPLAFSIIRNFIYEIDHYGGVLNANRTYYLTRSQPPFFSSMGLEYAKHIPDDSARRIFLRSVLEAAISEYAHVWMNPLHGTPIGLTRYYDYGSGVPPEVEPGHYDPIFRIYAEKYNTDIKTFEQDYRSGKINEPGLDIFFMHDRAMRESGHDTSYRLLDRCADLATVDLNSLLYKIEKDIASVIKEEFGGYFTRSDGSQEKAADWFRKAEKRKELVNRYLWDPERGMFFDYDFVRMEKTYYESAVTFYPMWAGLASREQAELLVRNALPLLEMPGGIAGSTENSRGAVTKEHPLRQWDYPFGWAPHQMLVWQGMINYGYHDIAKRLAYRWLYTITSNAEKYNGTVPEKFDVVNRTHEVFAEYGNIGTKFSYITKEGFGWTNASFQVGLKIIDRTLRGKLNRLIPPEDIFPPGGK